MVALLANKLQKLPGLTQTALKLAACTGHHFNLKTLAIVSEKTMLETGRELWPALAEGLILETSDFGLQPADLEAAEAELQFPLAQLQFKFLHDRVQQAAYALISAADKKSSHLKIGRLMGQNRAGEAQEEQLFDIVHHLNLGAALLERMEERVHLARLNLSAGRKALAASAYAPALQYLTTGIELLAAEEPWERHYELTLGLHISAAEAAYLATDFERAEALIAVVTGRARTLLDKVKVYEIRLLAYLAQDRLLEAIETGRQVLAMLGVFLPQKPTRAQAIISLLRVRLSLSAGRVEQLAALPAMADPQRLAAMAILRRLLIATYVARPEMSALAISHMVRLSRRYGHAPESPVAYAYYGLILAGRLGQVQLGRQLGRLALTLQEKFNVPYLKALIYLIFYYGLHHWQTHVREVIPPLLEGYQSGFESGEWDAGGALRLPALGGAEQGKRPGRKISPLAGWGGGGAKKRRHPDHQHHRQQKRRAARFAHRDQSLPGYFGRDYAGPAAGKVDGDGD